MIVINHSILPDFIKNKIEGRKTSLGRNRALPKHSSFMMDIVERGFNEAIENISRIENLESLDTTYLTNHLGKLIKECKDKERPIREKLEKVCYNAITSLFDIPDETINMKFELVDKLDPKEDFRLLPEESEPSSEDFSNLNQFTHTNMEVQKRRLINSLIQGASRRYAMTFECDDISQDLENLYYEITTINDYLLFTKEERISDKEPKQGACVEVLLGTEKKRTEINAQGLILPFLLQESIRGFMELFASHGLPEDRGEAYDIISKADFIKAEPWDLRLGIGLWNIIDNDTENHHKLLPYFFERISTLPTKHFIHIMRHVFMEDNVGQEYLDRLYSHAQRDMEYSDFENTLQLKNASKVRLNDGYISSEELDDYVIEEDNDDEPKKIRISEKQMMLLKDLVK